MTVHKDNSTIVGSSIRIKCHSVSLVAFVCMFVDFPWLTQKGALYKTTGLHLMMIISSLWLVHCGCSGLSRLFW